ncbi:Ppx/GppA phosphatase family protein [Sediminibacterium ginsengisoli]|uniref:Exopolyphosphatase / guanosine-5'-triphosphate,3'-diphosphate pyrophosphatase n=1 Tax=Sediminibacterium ginsengisoli TaxID=413434 RepID=A0A1T4L7E0_9BACT|nr:exopolyphosphatase [Sediminibacterium ginsengisoli]SJZ50584.1 exopolyphosphatase / guanosine-5'-triphosphate,3'-diphosphate pyrophosphatase [Sediminibacterium ginsengisoli]
MRLAAIDIGSNAARLLIVDVTTDAAGTPMFNKLNLVRVPLRLGFDVFEKGEISKEKRGMVLQTMKAYSHLLNAYQVEHTIACATSAMRDARNSADLIRKIRLETGLSIEIISGDLEASLIYENHVAEHMDPLHSYLYIDVGGGSTELTFFADDQLVFKDSFNIGTIRLLKQMVDDSMWDNMKNHIKQKTKGYKKIVAIGTGGNINKVFSLSKKKDGKPLPAELLKDYYKELSSVSLEERMRIYKFREDRADVIVPALQIYINVMRWADADEIYVPKIGLVDGLVQHLYYSLQPQS